MANENRYLKKGLRPGFFPVAIGTAGLLIFILLLNNFFPYKAANLKIGKSEAVKIASHFLRQKGYYLEGYNLMTAIACDNNAFFYLQKRHGLNKTREIFHKEQHNGLDYYWLVSWFKNLPKSSPYEQFRVRISGTGKIIAFTHEFPVNLDWPGGRQAHISQEKALEMAAAFLKKHDIDLNGYKKDTFNTQTYDKRTDHSFNWIKDLEFEGGKVNLSVVVQGDEVGIFDRVFGIPVSESAVINRTQERRVYPLIASLIFAFIFCLVLQLIFLKKYHEGEVSVNTAAIVFFACWISLVLESLIKFRINATSFLIGELGTDSVGVVVLVLFGLIAWPFLSIMGFSSWSIGESLGREHFNKKFTALDSIFNRKFSTLNAANSCFNGYFIGFFGLGLIALLTTTALTFFNGKIGGIDYRIASSTVPFLVPLLAALSSSLISELVFRLFSNFALYKYLKSKWMSIFISSVFWTVYAVAFWDVNISLSPMYLDWITWYICGVFFGYIFWKFDLLTVITANFIMVGVMQALPLLTGGAESLFYQGFAALMLLFLPFIFIVRGFIKGEIFSFEADLVPAHIKRITERARMAKELEIARQVQMQLLPGKSPEIKGFEIEGTCIPANEVGGDYYDFIKISDSKLGVVIGDVSGKGVPAAIYMTLTKGIIQSQVENENWYSPEQVLTRVNRSLYKIMDTKSFVTLFFGVIDTQKKTLSFSRAGHNPLLYFRRSDDRMITLKPEGIALGIEKGEIFNLVIKEECIELKKGDLIVFYTDGFTEAMNKELEEYGEKRLCRTILSSKDKPVSQIIDTVVADVHGFVKGYPQHDDMTMVVVKVF